MKDRKSFIIHDGFFELLASLPPDQCKEMVVAYGNYVLRGEIPNFDNPLMAAVFTREKAIADSDIRKYSDISETRRQAVLKRWDKAKTKENPVGYFGNPEKPSRTKSDSDNDSDGIQNDTNVYKCIICNTNDTDTDTDTDTVPTVSNTSRTDVLEDAEIVDIETKISGKNSKRVRAREKPEIPKEATWRDSFDVYLQDCRDAWKRWMNDRDWLEERRRFNPGVDIRLTLEKACKEFWATEAGWLHKKKGRGKTIDWKRIFEYAISQKTNRVYERSKDNSRGKDGLTDEEREQFERTFQGIINASRGR